MKTVPSRRFTQAQPAEGCSWPSDNYDGSSDDAYDDDCDDDDAAGDMILLRMVNFDTECSANSACARRRDDGDDDRQDGDDQ